LRHHSDTVTGATPLTIGVNLGHHYPTDGTWVAFLEHLGVNGALSAAQRRACRTAVDTFDLGDPKSRIHM
jgi:hypothetical protein